jgi:hypothetical protein
MSYETILMFFESLTISFYDESFWKSRYCSFLLHFINLKYWFRKDTILITLPNQYSNGILDFHAISDTDIGQYVCRGQNRGDFTEEIVTLEYSGRLKHFL